MSTRKRNLLHNKLFVGYDNYKKYILDIYTLIDQNGTEVKFNMNSIQQICDKYNISRSNGNIHQLIKGKYKHYKCILFRDIISYNDYIKGRDADADADTDKDRDLSQPKTMYKTFKLNINNGTYDIVFYSSSARTFIKDLWRTDSVRKMAKLHFLTKEDMEAYYETECKQFKITNKKDIKCLQLYELRKLFNSTSGNFQKFISGKSKMMDGWYIIQEQPCVKLKYNNTYEIKC